MTFEQELEWQRFLDAWPNCAVRGCQNKCCRALNSKYCWPHTPGTAQQARDNLLETEPHFLSENQS